MDVTGFGPIDYGVYLSPYTATVNGVPTTIICDDFANDTYYAETWTATTSTVANLASDVKWGNNAAGTKIYDEMAYLAYQLVNPANSSESIEAAISFALWDVSDGTDVSSFLTGKGYTSFLNNSSTTSGVAYWVAQAQNNYKTLTSSQLAAVTVYTPDLADKITNCGGGNCASNPPQEFLAISAVSTPETSGFSILAANLLGFAALALLYRRRMAAGK